MNELFNSIKELISKIKQELGESLTPLVEEYLTKIEELTHQWNTDSLFNKGLEEPEEVKKLYEELGISSDSEKQKVVKEVQRLAQLKGVEVNFSEKKDGEVHLNLDQKDKLGDFCPELVFWNFAWELASISQPEKNPDFWKNFFQELEWVKENLNEKYKKEFTNLLTPSFFPTEKLEMNQFLNVLYPDGEDFSDSKVLECKTNETLIDKTWQAIKGKLLELTSQELSKNPSEEELKKLEIKLAVNFNQPNYVITVQYHQESPFKEQIEKLITTTPLQLEVELLKEKQEQLPSAEDYIKLTKQKARLESYLVEYTNSEKLENIKKELENIK